MVLSALVRRLGETLVAAAGSPENGGGAGDEPERLPRVSALGKLVANLPVEELRRLFEGRATLDDDLELVKQAAGVFAAAFPPSAITAGEIALGVEALKFLLDAAGAGGATPTVHIRPGEPPLRGGFQGARGHV